MDGNNNKSDKRSGLPAWVAPALTLAITLANVVLEMINKGAL